jgi:hypothetical protein
MQQHSAHSPHVDGSALSHLLRAAGSDCVRYFDLFTGVYYQKNKDKRELAARRYAV